MNIEVAKFTHRGLGGRGLRKNSNSTNNQKHRPSAEISRAICDVTQLDGVLGINFRAGGPKPFKSTGSRATISSTPRNRFQPTYGMNAGPKQSGIPRRDVESFCCSVCRRKKQIAFELGRVSRVNTISSYAILVEGRGFRACFSAGVQLDNFNIGRLAWAQLHV